MQALTVTEPFADYAKGDRIIDADAVKAALQSNPHCVVAVDIPDPQPAEPAPGAPAESK